MLELNSESFDHALAFFQPVVQTIRQGNLPALEEIAKELKLCGDFRERSLKKSPNSLCDGFLKKKTLELLSLHEVSANLLQTIYETDPIAKSDLLFLAGLAKRNTKNYDSFLKLMEDYVSRHRNEKFADDALTEMGWFFMAIKNDQRTAQYYFSQVLDGFPDTNAYDNALNWMVISNRIEGDYVSAIKYSADLMAVVASDRLRRKMEGRHQSIIDDAKWITNPDQRIYVVLDDPSWGAGFGFDKYIRLVAVLDPNAILRVGDSVNGPDGQYFSNAAAFFAYLHQQKQSGVTEVTFELWRDFESDEPEVIKVPIRHFGV